MARLILDASDGYLSIVITKNNQIIASKKVECKQNLSELLLLKIDDCLQIAGIKKEDLQEIVATKGPGSYTALRVILTVAKSFSYALNIPIKTISTLRLKAAINQDKDSIIVALIDGRRGNVFASAYKQKVEVIKEDYYTLAGLLSKLSQFDEKIIFVASQFNQFNFESFDKTYEQIENQYIAENIIFVADDELEISDFYNANPSYLRKTEAERNL